MNVALMLKWIWRLYHEEGAISVQILRAKYPSATDIFACNGNGGSHFWRILHKIKHLFKLGASHMVVDGRHTLFWLDLWNGSEPLRSRFPSLFVICEDPTISVSRACGVPVAIRFRRSLDPVLKAAWQELAALVETVPLGEGADTVRWNLEPSGVFSVKSMYAKLSQGASVAHFKDVS
jgi:hypothetical protein